MSNFAITFHFELNPSEMKVLPSLRVRSSARRHLRICRQSRPFCTPSSESGAVTESQVIHSIQDFLFQPRDDYLQLVGN
jgi:hypothetical protein